MRNPPTVWDLEREEKQEQLRARYALEDRLRRLATEMRGVARGDVPLVSMSSEPLREYIERVADQLDDEVKRLTSRTD